MATKRNKGKNKLSKELKPTREDSLIKSYTLEETDLKVYKNKIVFVTVKDVQLVYYTNTQSFMDLLANYQSDFIITYEFAKGVQSTIDGQRIIKVKLPKLPKATT